jgi:hypothetical protein
MTTILIKPEFVEKGSAVKFSDQIINILRTEDELFVVGIGNATSLACMAVQRSASMARVFINELSLSYIGSPALGLAGVFFVLNSEPRRNWESEKEALEKGMNLSFDRSGQLIVISKRLLPEKIIPLCLFKFLETDLLKISATAGSIYRAISTALELTEGKIAPYELCIPLVALSTMKFTVGENISLETGIDIFIRKGKKTAHSGKHEQMLKDLQNR